MSDPVSHRHLVEHYVSKFGGWAALADELIRRLRSAGRSPPALDTVQKGLRRLTRRPAGDGGQYGRWLVKHFGIPRTMEARLRFVSAYHSRFSDLPSSLRLDQLRLWDRPPISESPLAVWVHVGLASVWHRMQQPERCLERMALAEPLAAQVGGHARMEVSLMGARLASDAGDDARTAEHLTEVGAMLDDAAQDDETLCYRARWVGQRAFQHTRGNAQGRFEDAYAWFAALPEDAGVPFVSYRRNAGMAYQSWKLGRTDEAVALALRAADHAGDGGFVRFRVMAYNLLARMHQGSDATHWRARARALAESIEDLHLMAVSRPRAS